MMFKFIIIIFISLYSFAAAKECRVDDNVIYSILLNEGLKNRAGYEYIISFNNKKDVVKAKRTPLKDLFVNNRTLDCKNKENCSKVLYELSKQGIINLDVGAFQINYRLHNLEKLGHYFDINKSYDFACNLVEDCIKSYGNTWYAYSCYHSRTKKYNDKYTVSLKSNYEKVKRRLSK